MGGQSRFARWAAPEGFPSPPAGPPPPSPEVVPRPAEMAASGDLPQPGGTLMPVLGDGAGGNKRTGW